MCAENRRKQTARSFSIRRLVSEFRHFLVAGVVRALRAACLTLSALRVYEFA